MCGRVNVSDPKGVQALLVHLDIEIAPARFDVRYNVAPGMLLLGAMDDGGPSLAAFEWGMVPPWAKPETFTRPLINARAETIWDKPSFRGLVKQRRAVVPVNGFYEWRRLKTGKQAFHFTHTTDGALALAAIHQVSKDGVPQVCLVTTAANAAMAPIHDRMPVILATGTLADWLNCSDRAQLDSLMAPCPPQWLQAQAVSDYVNNAGHEGAGCIEPL